MMPLDDNGFEMPENADVLESQKQLLKEKFGDDIDTSPGSVFGRLAMYNAQNIENTDNKEQQTYDGANVMTATGVQLDRQAANAGIQRNAPQNAVVQLKITGSAGYIVTEGTNFETQNGDIFSTIADVQLGDDGKGQVNAISTVAASYENVDANTITMQSEPVDDIISVTNPLPAQGGADLETDYDLRNRITQNNIARPGDTAEGLKTALMNVNGVVNVHMQNNISDGTDQYGNPPHSIHFYVSGGQNHDIFNALLNNAAYGTTFIGNIQEDAKVGTSVEHLAFDEALPQNIYFKLNLTTDSNYSEDAVKQAVDDFLSDFNMGDEIITNKLYMYLYQLDGVISVNDIELSTDDKNYSSNNIQLAKYQIARINDDDQDINITTNNSNSSEVTKND